MSRKGKKPIELPKGVEVKQTGSLVEVKGPKGLLSLEIKSNIDIEIKDGEVILSYDESQGQLSKFLGLYRSLIANLVEGTTKGFEKKLELIGVGYRAAVKGNSLDLSLGFSHPTEMPIPEGIQVAVEKNTVVTISGMDKQQVGLFASQIRALKPPEPYKGKGIRYQGEYVRRKAGKTGK